MQTSQQGRIGGVLSGAARKKCGRGERNFLRAHGQFHADKNIVHDMMSFRNDDFPATRDADWGGGILNARIIYMCTFYVGNIYAKN